MAKKHSNNYSASRNGGNSSTPRTSPNHPALRVEKDNVIQFEGVVVDVFPGARFKVKLDTNGMEILTHISGKMRMNSIRILPGDKVTVEVTTYDLRKGRIIFRAK